MKHEAMRIDAGGAIAGGRKAKPGPNTRLGRRRSAALACTAALLLLAPGCSRDGGSEGGGARVGRSPGAVAQVNRAVLREEELRQLVPAVLSESITGSEIREILDHWVTTELLYQKAIQEGLDRDPEVVEVLHQMQRQLLADEYRQRELRNRVRVTNEEIRAHYDAHINQYTQEVHLRHIVLDSPEEAEAVLVELRKGADFRASARKHSVDASSAGGGDLGYLGKGSMNPAFEPTVFEMAPNEVRGPIASSFGFHIVQVVRRRKAAEPVSFEVARDEILQTLLLEKKQDIERQLMMDLYRQATVHVARSYAGMALDTEDGAAAPRSEAEPPAAAAPGDETSQTP
jgi:peptidyl-prolyl cis-trans isomerase C